MRRAKAERRRVWRFAERKFGENRSNQSLASR